MIVAGIVAGGSGTRMGTAVPKQYLMLGNRCILLRTVDCFLAHPDIDLIILGVAQDYVAYTEDLLNRSLDSENRKRVIVVSGGADRNETLMHICEKAEELDASPDTILVTHDAVRPFVTQQMISDGIEKLRTSPERTAVTTAIPVVDTIIRCNDSRQVEEVPDRSTMFQAQTPQTVRLTELLELYRTVSPEERALRTDLSGLYRSQNRTVYTVPGSPKNRKITTPEDYETAAELFREELKE